MKTNYESYCCAESYYQTIYMVSHYNIQYRGGSRTSPLRGRQSLGGGGGLPNILVIFSEKPYEIKEILVWWERLPLQYGVKGVKQDPGSKK